MIPHSGLFVLILILTLFSCLHTASLNGDGRDQVWTHASPVAEHADQIHPADSSPWSSQTSRANMDATTPPMTNSLFSYVRVNSETNSNAQKHLRAAQTVKSNPKSSGNNQSANSVSNATWTENINSFKTDTVANNTSKTQKSSSVTHRDTGHSSETTLLAALGSSPHPASQVQSKALKAPEYTTTSESTHLHASQTSLDKGRLETRLSAAWLLGKSKAPAQKSDAELSDGTSLRQGQTDLLTTVQENRRMVEEFTKKPPHLVTNSPRGSLAIDDWNDDFTESSSQPDCNIDTTGVCNSSNPFWSLGLPDNNLSSALAPALPMPPPGKMTPPPSVIMTPPLLVPLFSDWNAAMATWGLAWELQVYGLGCVFSLVAVLSALSLLCLPLCQPSGCANFTLLHLLQLLIGSSRAFWLLYDPYGQRERLPVAWARLLHEAGYPCLTGAFGMLLVLLSPQLLSQNALRRCICLLAALMLLHVATVMGAVGILWLFPALPVVSLLPPAAFLLLSCPLSVSYLLFYCCARADAKHIYRLRENSPDRLSCQASQSPLGEAGIWERAAGMGLFSALFLLACGGLRLYAILHAVGLISGGRMGLMPWPWWAFQLSCRVCEACVCLTLALILSHPLLCCGAAHLKLGRWCSWFNRSPTGNTVIAKPQILSSGWTKKSGDTLVLHETMSQHESESVPLYTLAELPLGESEGLDLNYPNSPQHLAPTQPPKNGRLVSQPSFISLDCDSTVDLRPPSPIDLRRSIDEALNSEALFHRSLFSSSRLSLSTREPPDGQPCRGIPAEPSLYRTASCGDVDSPSVPSPPPLRSSTAWRAPNFSSLRGGTRSHGGQAAFYTGFGPGRHSQKQYKALGSISSREHLYDQQHVHTQADELAVQAEFINVCRQIDALSVSSDTIEL